MQIYNYMSIYKHKHIDIYSNAQILGIEKGTD